MLQDAPLHSRSRRSLDVAASVLLAAAVALACLPALPAHAQSVGDEASVPSESAEPAAARGSWDWTRPFAIALDVGLLRPLGTLATSIGCAAFTISTPLVVPFGNVRESWEIFVKGPADYTFKRPLGDL